MRIRESISFGGRRRHLAVNYWNGHPKKNYEGRGWCLQWATPTQHGYSYQKPIEFGFRTKVEASDRKRRIYLDLRRGVEAWNASIE